MNNEQKRYYDTNTRFANERAAVKRLKRAIEDMENLGRQRRFEIAVRYPEPGREAALAAQYFEALADIQRKIYAVESTPLSEARLADG